MLKNQDFTIVAGDDFAFSVDISVDDVPIDFADGHKAIMTIHAPTGTKEVKAIEYNGNTANFYLSGEKTASFLQKNTSSEIAFCIAILWANGGKTTVVYDSKIKILRC